MANVVGVVLVGVEEKAQVAGGTVWFTVSATAAVTGGVQVKQSLPVLAQVEFPQLIQPQIEQVKVTQQQLELER